MVDKRFYKHLGARTLIELLDGMDVDIPEGQFCDTILENAAPVGQAGGADITYLDGKGVAKNARDCKAAACFVSADNAEHVGQAGVLPLISKFPQADFSQILEGLYQPLGYGKYAVGSRFQGVDIGLGVVIGDGARIGADTSIGPNTVIGPGVVIGRNCQIGANVVIEFSVLGDRCKIYHGAVIGGSGFGVARSASGGADIPHVGIVELGNDVTVGSNTTIDRAMFGATSIGDGTKLDNLIQIAHNAKIGKNCLFAAHVGISGSCNIGDGVIMGGKAGVPDHVTIGDGAVLSAMANTMHDIPAGEMWGGTPALPMRGYMRQVSYLRRIAKPKAKPKS